MMGVKSTYTYKDTSCIDKAGGREKAMGSTRGSGDDR